MFQKRKNQISFDIIRLDCNVRYTPFDGFWLKSQLTSKIRFSTSPFPPIPAAVTSILTALRTAYFYGQMTFDVGIQQPRAILMVIKVQRALPDHDGWLENAGVLVDHPITAHHVVFERVLGQVFESFVGPAVLGYRVHQVDGRPRFDGHRQPFGLDRETIFRVF